MLIIEKDIPIPEIDWNREITDKMQIGDSVFLPGGGRKENRILWATKKRFDTQGKKIITRQENGGIRIWRTA